MEDMGTERGRGEKGKEEFGEERGGVLTKSHKFVILGTNKRYFCAAK